MLKLANRVDALKSSSIMEISSRAAEMKAKGLDVISLGVGDGSTEVRESRDGPDQIVYDGKRYSIEKVQELDVKAGYIIDCRFTQAVRPRNIIERSVEQALVIEETLTNE